MRRVIPGATLTALGVQIALSSFFVSILGYAATLSERDPRAIRHSTHTRRLRGGAPTACRSPARASFTSRVGASVPGRLPARCGRPPAGGARFRMRPRLGDPVLLRRPRGRAGGGRRHLGAVAGGGPPEHGAGGEFMYSTSYVRTRPSARLLQRGLPSHPAGERRGVVQYIRQPPAPAATSRCGRTTPGTRARDGHVAHPLRPRRAMCRRGRPRAAAAAGFEIVRTDFLFIFPRGPPRSGLRGSRRPLGAQYQVFARRPERVGRRSALLQAVEGPRGLVEEVGCPVRRECDQAEVVRPAVAGHPDPRARAKSAEFSMRDQCGLVARGW